MKKYFYILLSLFVVFAGVKPVSAATLTASDVDLSACYGTTIDVVKFQQTIDSNPDKEYIYKVGGFRDVVGKHECSIVFSPEPLEFYAEGNYFYADTSVPYNSIVILRHNNGLDVPRSDYQIENAWDGNILVELLSPLDAGPTEPNSEDFGGWFGDLGGSIKDLGSTIVTGITNAIEDIFVPKDGVFEEFFNNIKTGLIEQMGYQAYLDLFKELDSTNLQEREFTDVKVDNLNIAGVQLPEMTLIESDIINDNIYRFHNILRGFVFLLLLLAILNDFYKLVRGTSLIDLNVVINKTKD
jgi:hypothetical protein